MYVTVGIDHIYNLFNKFKKIVFFITVTRKNMLKVYKLISCLHL